MRHQTRAIVGLLIINNKMGLLLGFGPGMDGAKDSRPATSWRRKVFDVAAATVLGAELSPKSPMHSGTALMVYGPIVMSLPLPSRMYTYSWWTPSECNTYSHTSWPSVPVLRQQASNPSECLANGHRRYPIEKVLLAETKLALLLTTA